MDWHLKIFKGINLKAEDLHVNKKTDFAYHNLRIQYI
jgi:hypothetical protein